VSLDYIAINKKSWNERVDTHIASAFYDLEGFINGNTSLNDIELKLLGDIKGKEVLHLQCHFGQDSISLSRMGGKVTGVDLSDKSISKARELASICEVDTEFIESDIYALNKVHSKKYDIIFTSYGTIGWLPDLTRWANIISNFLKPNGQFIFVDFHPVLWMYDESLQKIKYRYFNSEPIVEEGSTYTDGSAGLQIKSVGWNHGMSETIQALLNKGMKLLEITEYDYSPYDCFPDLESIDRKKYRHKVYGNKIPYVYSMILQKGI